MSAVHPLPSSASDVPIGTIVMSFLTWAQFETVTQNNVNNPAGPSWSPKYSKWAPADGRQVPGSTLSTAASEVTLPDLRGVFSRGLNSFDPTGEPFPIDGAKKDPDARTRGSYQDESLKSHSHGGSTGPDAPDHTHWFGGYTYGTDYGSANSAQNLTVAVNNFNRQTDGASARHTHQIPPEGSAETRPKNVAIYYYIRIN